MIVDLDDFGADITISDQCQTRDCRTELTILKTINPAFKVTLFAVPFRMSVELLEWALDNNEWVQLAVHGWAHGDNYEASEWSMQQCLEVLEHPIVQAYFVKGFKAPGWQISNACYEALVREGFWVADQSYNDKRRLDKLKSYVIREDTPSWHGHTWNCMGNGIEESLELLKDLVSNTPKFKFISEVVK